VFNLGHLKYCRSARDQCYHAMEVDVGGRPHEFLNLRIKDVEFVEAGGSRYAKILVNGKTGQRSLVLIDSIPFVTLVSCEISSLSANPDRVSVRITRGCRVSCSRSA
jgi:hypothetical protein